MCARNLQRKFRHCCGIVLACAGFPLQALADDAGHGVAIVAAQDDPFPLFKISRKALEGTVIEAIGAHPLGKIPLTFYKTVDLARELGVAATGHEDASHGAALILIDADAALLKGLRARGVDLNDDPKAVAAKNRLRAQMQGLEDSNYRETPTDNLPSFVIPAIKAKDDLLHVGAVVVKHLPYAVAKVGMNKAIGAGAGKLIGKLTPWIDKIFPIGDEVRSVVGNKSALASGLRYVGWRKLGARANVAKKYTDKLMHKLVQASIDNLVMDQLRKRIGEAFDHLYREVMAVHPSKPVARELRLTVSRAPVVYAPLMAAPLALPVAAPAVPLAVPALPRPAVVETARDPVANTIYVEDSYTRFRPRDTETSRPREEPRREPEPKIEPPTKSRFHDELMCVGAGNKPGCGSWDGRRGGNLHNR